MDEKVLGSYRLLSELGSGGMATVHLATPVEPVKGIEPGEKVAIKVLHEHLVTESTFYERFRREAEVGARIRHENVVRTLDVGMSEENDHQESFMVMEYVEGQTIRQLVDELGWLPEDLCRHIGREVAKALSAIHAEGIVHRDLKPENIIITKDDVVKVMDLGVALLADRAIRLSLTGQFVGSVFYASPEQIQGGGKDVDTRVDFYQLGVVLYELASGIHPYRDDDLRTSLRRLLTEEPRRLSEMNSQVSPFLDEVV
ncbi:MAG: serine/threonine protein kinase, partial [Planctomycetota bacterium]